VHSDVEERNELHLAIHNLPPVETTVMVSAPVVADAQAASHELPDDGLDLKDHMARIELKLISDALERTQGVVAHAAQLLGLRRTTLVEKLRKYGIDREQLEVAG
jgi:sigma-54 specific flagellar transcriptional regulator A